MTNKNRKINDKFKQKKMGAWKAPRLEVRSLQQARNAHISPLNFTSDKNK